MSKIDVFCQAPGLTEMVHCEVDATLTVHELKQQLCQTHQLEADAELFFEDEENAAEDDHVLADVGDVMLKVHLNRCRRIGVSVTFNGETESRRFSPSATVARVKRWAARKFELCDADASEHVLQLIEVGDRPTPSTHIGTLTECPDCAIGFDLVPDERVNGSR